MRRTDDGVFPDQGLDDGDDGRETGLPRTVALPPPLPDQIEYLRTLQVAVSGYDPDVVIRGRRPPLEGDG